MQAYSQLLWCIASLYSFKGLNWHLWSMSTISNISIYINYISISNFDIWHFYADRVLPPLSNCLYDFQLFLKIVCIFGPLLLQEEGKTQLEIFILIIPYTPIFWSSYYREILFPSHSNFVIEMFLSSLSR